MTRSRIRILLLCALAAGCGEQTRPMHGVPMARPLALRLAGPPRTGSALDGGAPAHSRRASAVRRVPVYRRVILDLDLAATYDNPFDPEDVRVDAEVREPTGRTWSAPGFLYRPHRATDRRQVVPAGPEAWQVRIAFRVPGRHRVTVRAADRTGAAELPPLTFDATPSAAPGMVRRHRADPYYFVTDRGETFFPVGANVCWGEHDRRKRGLFAYDDWFARYAASGGNYSRLWLSTPWSHFALVTEESGYDRIDLKNAWQLDYVLDLAERLGLRLMLAIDSFNMLMEKEWHRSPYAAAAGGPLNRPAAFFTDERMRRACRNRLRYLVGRYGSSPNVMAWEFFNEVDLTQDYDSAAVADWHRDMARHLRRIDPWKHLITTSFSRHDGDPPVDSLPDLDFVQTHTYNGRDMGAELDMAAAKDAARDRPHFIGEFGFSDPKVAAAQDPDGIHLHNALYASVGQMHAGAPMLWWWNSYIPDRDLYRVQGAFARWIAGFDFVRQHARRLEASTYFHDPYTPRPVRDLLLDGVAAVWDHDQIPPPAVATVGPRGELAVTGTPPRVMHGLGHHHVLHNPMTFVVNLHRPTSFGVRIEGVSGHGGGELLILVDGRVRLDKVFADPDGKENTETLTQYDGWYEADVPAGSHVLIVENVGDEWFNTAEYRFDDVLQSDAPPLRALGVVGETAGLLWVQNVQHTWKQVSAPDYRSFTVQGASLRAGGFAPGTWTVERWDTRKGVAVAATQHTVGPDGRLELMLPPIRTDVAFRLRLRE